MTHGELPLQIRLTGSLMDKCTVHRSIYILLLLHSYPNLSIDMHMFFGYITVFGHRYSPATLTNSAVSFSVAPFR